MSTALALNVDALAPHRNAARYGTPVEYRLDSDGSGVAVSLPSPAALAAWLTFADTDAYRRGSAILTRPHGSDDEPMPVALADLAATLRTVLAVLPARPDAQAPYRDLRLAASTPSPRFDAYLLGVLRARRLTLPAAPARPKAQTTGAKSDTERNRAYRSGVRLAETASALWWLDTYLTDEDEPAEPGSTMTAAALYAEARDALEALANDEEPLDENDPGSPTFRVPRQRVFLAAASDVLGKPRRTENGTTFTIPEESRVTPTGSLIERAAQVLAAATIPATIADGARRH